jgi:hypothetical protein
MAPLYQLTATYSGASPQVAPDYLSRRGVVWFKRGEPSPAPAVGGAREGMDHSAAMEASKLPSSIGWKGAYPHLEDTDRKPESRQEKAALNTHCQ